ncbi:MAG: hypothetical protein ACPLVI_04555 [Thermoplasmata archaeon]|jgi:endogenous inhibitor of DNA gyrase (YacG/DUF329 family)
MAEKMKKKKMKKKKRKITCIFCGRHFKTYNALNAHLRFCTKRPKNIRKWKEEKRKREKIIIGV